MATRKRARHCIRERLAVDIPRMVGPRQYGGIKQRGTQHATMLLRLLQTTAQVQKYTFGGLLP